ncbi:unnamed protein product [Acanthoscelides obtectus]|uniref:Uncharacterized protein n=1 Tax=Acanthoscelides obtectus TaxID=200917 RepID=A0A9P0PUD7_ACAOB|nr:unnamed protein product [Acanthoscelides obtectus]CAK1624280.1 hypothetical protein AOBTE_LOCUS2466 [Acanthoscelides obtectus]
MGPATTPTGGVGGPTTPSPVGGATVAPPMGGETVGGAAGGPAPQPGSVDLSQQPSSAQAILRPSDQGTVYQDSYVSFLNQTPGTTFWIFLFCYVFRVIDIKKPIPLGFENFFALITVLFHLMEKMR